jgi:hypothetical protein
VFRKQLRWSGQTSGVTLPESACSDGSKKVQRPAVALTLARKIAAITLTLWKKGENFDAEKLKSQAA